jgi:hypothetical protein
MLIDRVSLLLALIVLIFTPSLFATEEPVPAEAVAKIAEAAKELPQQFENKPLLFIPQLDAPKQLKGDLSDPVWEKAAPFKLIAVEKGEIVPARFTTVGHIFCTADALYVGVKLDDPDPATATVSNPMAWQNDSIEFFLYPGESCKGGKMYYQIVIDAAKKVEFYHTHIYPKQGFRNLTEAWKPSADCEVTKDATSWTLELKLKFSDLSLSDEARAKKSVWRMDMFRNRCERGGIKSQSYAWTPTDGSGSYHVCGRYGYVLPAAFATPEFVAELAARAKESAPELAPSQERITTIMELIGRLGNDDYNIRNTAMLNLNSMVEEKKPLATFIQKLLKKTLAETDDSEVKLRSIKVLNVCNSALNPDDDEIAPEFEAIQRE